MKYIPGYTFTVGVTNESHKVGGSLLAQKKNNFRNEKDFLHGVTYTIYNIQPTDEKVIYTFKTNNPEQPSVNHEFQSIGEAEARISKIVGA